MLIQIRIVIHVPEMDKLRFPEAIEKIVEFVISQFPNMQTDKAHSPVTVTIRDLKAETA